MHRLGDGNPDVAADAVDDVVDGIDDALDGQINLGGRAVSAEAPEWDEQTMMPYPPPVGRVTSLLYTAAVGTMKVRIETPVNYQAGTDIV